MKVLSLLQPWASLWVAGAKRIETRSWGTSYRGRIAVAASKRFDQEDMRLCLEEPFLSVLTGLGVRKFRDMPTGKILGWVTLTDCLSMGGMFFRLDDRNPLLTYNERSFGNYAPGRYAWLTSSERFILDQPIPFKGGLGLRDLPVDIVASVEAPEGPPPGERGTP